MQKNYRKKSVKTKWIFLVIAVIMLVYLVGTAISIWNYGNVDEKRSADVAIVLGAGTYGGEVSPVFQERLNHGIWLYKNNYVKKLIFTGGVGEGNQYSDAYVAKQYAVEQGIPNEDILLEEESTITQENIENARKINCFF